MKSQPCLFVDDGATYDIVDLPGRKGVVASRSVYPPSLPEISAVRVAVGCSRATVGSTISPKVVKGVVVVAAPKWPHTHPQAPNEVNPRLYRLILARRRPRCPRPNPWAGRGVCVRGNGRSSEAPQRKRVAKSSCHVRLLRHYFGHGHFAASSPTLYVF